MSIPEPKRSRTLATGWLIAVFAISAVTDLRALAVLSVLAPLVFPRYAWAVFCKLLVTVIPLAGLLVAASWAWLGLVEGTTPAWQPFAALFLRPALIAFVTFSVLKRVDLLGAVAAWPTASRLLVVTLAQIHALRLLATESYQGLRSRLPMKPRANLAVRSAGGVTAALFQLASRNARDVTDALRSRGL